MVDLTRRRLFSKKRHDPEPATRLPWLKSHALFIDKCTRCQHCLTACETSIIVKGEGGFPTVDFTIDECTFCYQCATVCPEDLFLEQDQTPWQVTAKIDNRCLATNNVECRSCQDICEPMAIQFKLQSGQVAQPNLDISLCNGCGACVSICPTKAIVMISKKSAIHQ
ncbi:ferredoxin-type protein NapF [Vibrio sp. SS-MA-C1-2]|uniref:ferredoxin-type protein NapF n=1 Tax=Vibrio sp. SS-MA-C1-2 TaxID=2908646 RepID=UPI001F32590D|nr:ferredoxin-type protein NapF [Vibrio sp. SS-MA-C1-2]UJF16922.1 ferredoxin-type protein NapF [Vibrio sp. SS-MA-C1-2]